MQMATLNSSNRIQVLVDGNWQTLAKLPGVASIALVADGLWANANKGDLFSWNDESKKWVRDESLTGVTLLTIANDGALHALQTRGEVYKRAGDQWQATTADIKPLANQQPKRLSRGWLRFGLQALLFSVVMPALILGPLTIWYSRWQSNSSNQQLAITMIEVNGGTVKYAHQFDANGVEILKPKLPATPWLRSTFGKHAFLTPVELDWNSPGVESSPIESLGTLRRLSFTLHTQEDVDRVGTLTNLRKLNVIVPQREVFEIDCGPLGNLSSLSDLKMVIHNEKLNVDLSFLGKLKKLKHVNIAANKFVDVSGLESAGELESATIWPAKSLKGLGGSPMLTKVDVQRNDWGDDFHDLSGIEGAVNLVELNAARSKVEDLTPLANLKKLEKLDLTETRVTDLSPLKNITSLRELMLDGYAMKTDSSSDTFDPFEIDSDPGINLWPLIGLKNIHELDLSNREIADKKVLAELTQITKLTIAGNSIFTWDIEKMSQLKSLTCYSGLNQKLDRFALLTNLEELTLHFRPYGSINYQPLRALKKLKILRVNRTGSFNFINALPELTEFHFDSDWDVGLDLTPLAKHPKLKTITVADEIIDIKDFRKQKAKKLLSDN